MAPATVFFATSAGVNLKTAHPLTAVEVFFAELHVP